MSDIETGSDKSSFHPIEFGWRPTFAYLCAAMVGSQIYHYVSISLEYASGVPGGWSEIFASMWIFALFIGVLASLALAAPTFGAVILVKRWQLPRGWADIGYGAVIASILSFHNFIVLFSKDTFGETITSYAATRAVPTVLGGGFAGLTYWLVAGRPKALRYPKAR